MRDKVFFYLAVIIVTVSLALVGIVWIRFEKFPVELFGACAIFVWIAIAKWREL